MKSKDEIIDIAREDIIRNVQDEIWGRGMRDLNMFNFIYDGVGCDILRNFETNMIDKVKGDTSKKVRLYLKSNNALR